METHRLKDEIKHFIQNYTIDQGASRPKDQKAIDADLLWDASRFWATITHKSSSASEKITYSEFLNYKSHYEAQHNITINSDGLFDRFWLRKVLGLVEIPGGISRLGYTFEKISKHKDEFKFLDYLYSSQPEKVKCIDKNQILPILEDYNKTNHTNIVIENIWGLKEFEIKDDIIKLDNFEHYYLPFLIYWDDFEFIINLKNEYNTGDRGLEIRKSDFIQIRDSFAQLFTTPTVESFTAQKVIRPISDDVYCINFHNTDTDYHCLWDKVAGIYWEMLLVDSSFGSNKERILTYLSKMLYWEDYPNALSYCSEKAKRCFLDEAFSLIEGEKDLEGVEVEIKKVHIDSPHIHDIYEITSERLANEFSLNNVDLFELYDSVSKLEQKAHITFLHDQRSRKWIFYLLWIIVKNDIEFENEEDENPEKETTRYNYKRIKELLLSSIEKPSLLGMIVHNIICHRREIIPYLLINQGFVSLSFQIIDQFKFPEEEKETLSNKLWIKSLQLALMTISSSNNKETASKLIFQIFRQINTNKYEINANPRNQIRNTPFADREKLLLDLIEKSPKNSHIYYHRTIEEFLLPTIFNELAQLFLDYKEDNTYNNGVVKLPLMKLDGLSWLMKCSTYWKYKKQLSDSDFIIQPIIYGFYNLYIETIEINEIEQYDFINQKRTKAIPIWAEKRERIKVVDWLFPIWFIYKNRLLNKFIEPEFKFECHSGFFNKQNSFTADKLRSHIVILLQIHEKLILPTIPYGLKKETLSTIKRRIEEKMLDILEDNLENKPEEGKIDIFDFNQEWKFHASQNEVLLPQVAGAINYFGNKGALIDIIIKSNDIIKILTFTEYISSESIKQYLIKKVKETDIGSFLRNTNWIPEIQTTLTKIAQYPELIPQVETVIDFWRKEIIAKKTKQKEYKNVLFQTQLILAYFKSDEEELKAIQTPPNDGVVIVGDISNSEMKDFYLALIKMKDSPGISYNIFNRLIKAYPKYVNIALNRMAAKISLAEKDKNINYYYEALEEWEEYKNTGKDIDEKKLGTTFLANKMLILFETHQYELLNEMFLDLDLLSKMNPEILKVYIDSLEAQGNYFEASRLQEEAEKFHKNTSSSDLKIIRKFNVEDEKVIRQLKFYYNEILNCSPELFVKILPERFNGRLVFGEFFTKEIALGASKMLDKIMSISDIRSEDKYNDIIELAIDSRINTWGWFVNAQSRGGFSNPDDKSTPKQPGERDLPIVTANKSPICICEAFIYRDKTTALDHVQKIFNYYHQKENFVILIYNLDIKKYKNNWQTYLNEIIPKANYPTDYKYLSSQDVTNDFGYNNSGIKIAQSIHGNDMIMHHIFVNIDYRNVP